jgi:hypothetical protein
MNSIIDSYKMQSHNYSYEIIFLDDGSMIIHGLLSMISTKP